MNQSGSSIWSESMNRANRERGEHGTENAGSCSGPNVDPYGLALPPGCGWSVGTVAADGQGMPIIELVRDQAMDLTCAKCGVVARWTLKDRPRAWMHVLLDGSSARVVAQIPSVMCPTHDETTCAVPWAKRGAKITDTARAYRGLAPEVRLGTRLRKQPPPKLTGASLPGRDFTGAVLRGTSFARADLRGSRFEAADLEGADFELADLRGASFRGAQLKLVDFGGARLDCADFSRAIGEWTNWLHASAPKAVFSGSQLRFARMGCACFDGARFDSVDLYGASFWEASLIGADFSATDLADVDFDGAKGGPEEVQDGE